MLNGTQGVNEALAGLVGQGLTILDTLKKSASVPGHGATGNGAAPVPVPAAARADL